MNMIGLLLFISSGLSPAGYLSVVSYMLSPGIVNSVPASGEAADGTHAYLTVPAGNTFEADTTPRINAYLPEHFTDRGRAKRMASAFPVIEKIYREYAEKNKIPGFAFGITGDDRLLYTGAFGYTSTDKKTPVTSASVFRIASMTKSFAAMAIIKLRDEGKLDLDDPVSKFIPGLKNTPPLTGDAPPVTIRNLVSHTAGYPEDNPWADRQLQRTDKELEDFIRKGISLSSTPGLSYEYSNLGFAMLGIIITKASGVHYEQYIRDHTFKPLGMQHTYWEYSDVPEALLVHGYRLVNGQWVEEPMLHSGAYGVMGGMLTSVEDFSKYMNFHLSAWPPRTGNDTGLIRRSSLREMHLPGPVSNLNAQTLNSQGELCPKISSYNFGLGWSKDCNGRVQVSHSGGLPGFGTHWVILPQYNIGLVTFSSLTYAATIALNNRIIDTLLAIADLQPRQLPASSILEQRKNELAALLPDWENAPATGIFSENFFLDNFTDSLRAQSRRLFSQAGRIFRVGKIQPENQLRGSFVIEGENGNLLAWFSLSPESPALIQKFTLHALAPSGDLYKKYGLKTISDIDVYKRSVQKDPDQELVALNRFIPGISLDVRYATGNNLMKEPVYSTAAVFMRRPAAEALKKIQRELNKKGLGLKVYDGYRPYRATVAFYEAFRDSVFVASPYTGSRHNRGCAIDLTIINLKTGKELEMPTPFDTFSDRAHSAYPGLPAKQLKNRELLKQVMTSNGFMVYPAEWWHFDFTDWKKYPVTDIPFEYLLTP